MHTHTLALLHAWANGQYQLCWPEADQLSHTWGLMTNLDMFASDDDGLIWFQGFSGCSQAYHYC